MNASLLSTICLLRPLCALAVLAALPLFGATARASTADEEEQIVRSIQMPDIPARDFVITAYGAKPDGVSDARPAIQAAIAAAKEAGGGRVVIPKGNWLSDGPIHLASRIDLHVDEGATLLFGPNPAKYLPAVLTRWEGTELHSYSPLIYGFEVHDVAITGKGVIDGNGVSVFHSWVDKQEKDQQALRKWGSMARLRPNVCSPRAHSCVRR